MNLSPSLFSEVYYILFSHLNFNINLFDTRSFCVLTVYLGVCSSPSILIILIKDFIRYSMKTYLPPGWAWRPQRGAPAAAPCTCAQHWGHWSVASRPPESRAWRPGCGTSFGRCRECHRRWWCSGRGGCHWAGTRSTTAAPTEEKKKKKGTHEVVLINSVTWSLTASATLYHFQWAVHEQSAQGAQLCANIRESGLQWKGPQKECVHNAGCCWKRLNMLNKPFLDLKNGNSQSHI